MNADDIAGRVRKIIIKHLGVDAAPDDSSIRDDLGADSLDLVELAMAVEDEFGIEVPEDEFENALTVLDVIKLVRGKVAP